MCRTTAHLAENYEIRKEALVVVDWKVNLLDVFVEHRLSDRILMKYPNKLYRQGFLE